MTYYAFIDTPAGEALFIGDGKVVSGIHWKVFKRAPKVGADWVENKEVFKKAIGELDEYFAGKRTSFSFPFAAKGTAFQEKVWNALLKIPYGTSITYKDIAHAVGNPAAVRAVGTAVGSNPISIVVPCHRVLSSSNGLAGYAGGLPSKELLLKTEGIGWRGAGTI